MSTAKEIEDAILALSPEELEELTSWWEDFRLSEKRSAKREALEATAGYLKAEDEDFIEAVANAGKDVACEPQH